MERGTSNNNCFFGDNISKVAHNAGTVMADNAGKLLHKGNQRPFINEEL